MPMKKGWIYLPAPTHNDAKTYSEWFSTEFKWLFIACFYFCNWR